MDSFYIGFSGLDAAQKAFGVIGNNIANAATPGYHRQRINLTPADTTQIGLVITGGGVDVGGITRMIDSLLEQEILRQQSSLAQLSRELDSMRTVETTFGELSGSSSLNAAIDEFFNALQDLSGHPGEVIWQNQVVMTAQNMTSRFRTLGESLTTLETQIRLEAENAISQVNTLSSQIAELNDKIRRIEITGGRANNLRDQRDQCITELAELIGVETQSKEYGVVDVVVTGGISMVTGSSASELEVGLQDGKLGITIVGAGSYYTDVEGGRIGGLLSLRNSLVSDVHTDLDSLASAIIQQINQYHVQGVGSYGSFTGNGLTGWVNSSEDLSDFSTITDGEIYIRLIDTSGSTNVITRELIDIDADDDDAGCDTLTEVAAAIDAIAGLTASVNSSNQLVIDPDTDYEFDFLPAVLPEPESGDINFNGSTDPTVGVSGVYKGNSYRPTVSNDTFTFTVSGTGNVGVHTLTLTVTDGDSNTIDTIDIGSGYAAGDKIDVGDTGIKISLSTGDLVAGDTFAIDVFTDTDTSGLLAAVGINTFFSGSSATNIAVCSDIAATPGRIATSLGPEMTDNTNVLLMAGLSDETVSSLDDLSPGEFYRRLVTSVGQKVFIRQMQEDNIEVMVQSLAGQQNDISGVSINDEAGKMLIFEQMFQAMAKYLGAVQSLTSAIMEII
jgi:flagellar hook-associated protein 1 FlgK